MTPRRIFGTGALRGILEFLAIAGLAILMLIALLACVDVILRWALWPRVYGLSDLTEIIFAVIVASTFPAGLLRGGALSIRVVGRAMGEHANHAFEVIAGFVTLGFFALVTWTLAQQSVDMILAGRTTSTLGMPLAPWLSIMTLCFALSVIAQAARCIEMVRNKVTSPPDALGPTL